MDKANKCSECMHICTSIIDGNLLCKLNGVVYPNYSCKKFSYNYSGNWHNFDNIVNRKKCIECSHFKHSYSSFYSKNANSSYTLGTCGMFLVREFDGAVKNACSKISLLSPQTDVI